MPKNTDYDDLDDDDEDDEQELSGESLVKQLRKQLKAANKELNANKEQLAKFEKRDREENVAAALKAAEVDARYAKWVVRDLDGQDLNAENVAKWLQDNADLVGFQPAKESTVSDESQQSLQRFQGAERGGKGADADPIAAALSDPNLTPEKWQEIVGKNLAS